ncbi:GerMN domain-containing protein [Bacillaceae bacterium Marseille-Q3522]|nr:GerMN domain-containing protein [Bacillaceae bacterium Marseille-Q3522]
MAMKKSAFVLALLLATMFLSACGMLNGNNNEEIDPPKDVIYTEDENTETAGEDPGEQGEENTEGSVQTELYLIDKNGYVVPQTLALPKTESVAKQALDYLVAGGPVTELLPNGFRAVLPEETKISINVENKVATVDFSNEFQQYQPEDEEKILQSITWTLTQFDSIEKVKLKMNGNELKEMPVNGTPLKETLSRNDGINLDTTDALDITNTKPVTVYYLGGEEGAYYYVPVTKRIDDNHENKMAAIVEELVKGPSYSSQLFTEFVSDVALEEEPIVKDGTVTLNFNESIYHSFKEKIISQNVINALALSLTEQQEVKNIAITVKGETDITTENGEKLTEPVTRPEKVNTGSF